MRNFTQGFAGYAVALLVCLGAIGLFLLVTPQSRTERIPRVDYSMDLAHLRRTAPYQVVAPARLPDDWIPTSSRQVTENGAVTWRLGFATARREHAMLAQSNERPAAEFASRMANTDKAVGTQQINGVTWERRVREDKNQRSLVRLGGEPTVVITGTADWSELTTLASVLQAQPRPAETPTAGSGAGP